MCKQSSYREQVNWQCSQESRFTRELETGEGNGTAVQGMWARLTWSGELDRHILLLYSIVVAFNPFHVMLNSIVMFHNTSRGSCQVWGHVWFVYIEQNLRTMREIAHVTV